MELNTSKRARYSQFFKEFVDFSVEVGRDSYQMFEGLFEEECASMMLNYNAQFDPCLTAYLLLTGRKINNLPLNFFSRMYESMENANSHCQDILSRFDIDQKLRICEVDELVGINLPELDLPLKSVVLLDYYDIGDGYILLDGNDENSFVYTYFVGSKGFDFDYMRFTELFRTSYIGNLLYDCKNLMWDNSNEIISKLLQYDWMQFYKLFMQSTDFFERIGSYRFQFYSEYHEEFRHDLPSIHDGERKFINYLLDKKLVKI